jgi:hypothetical protein
MSLRYTLVILYYRWMLLIVLFLSKCLQSNKLRKALMCGYSLIIRAVDLGKEAKYVTILEP